MAVDRWTVVGMLGAVLAFAGVATFALVTLPWEGTFDSTSHLDYMYQLDRGHLPAPRGMEFMYPGGDEPHTGRQFASAHPPFYYLLVLAFVSPFEQGDWESVVATGRVVNTVAGSVCVILLGWVGWMLGGRHRRRMAVGAAATGALTVSFVRFAGEIYNDVLVATLATAVLAISVAILRRGPSWQRVGVLAVLCAFGMLTKATFVVPWALSIGALGVASLTHSGGPAGRRLVVCGFRVLPVVVVPVLAAGWFYLRNRSLSGSWFRSSPREPLGGRKLRTMEDNLTDLEFYLIVPERLLGNIEIATGPISNFELSLFLFVLAAVVSMLAVRASRRSVRRGRGDTHDRMRRFRNVLAALVPVGALLGAYVTQLNHATGYGAYNFRYFLPATIAVGLIFALAGTAVGRWSALLVPAFMLCLLWGSVAYSTHLSETRFASETGAQTGFHAVLATADLNGVGPAVVVACLAVSLGGTLVVGLALWQSSDDGASQTMPTRPAKPSTTPRHMRAARRRRSLGTRALKATNFASQTT